MAALLLSGRLALLASNLTRLRNRTTTLALCLITLLIYPLIQLYDIDETNSYTRSLPVYPSLAVKPGHPQSTFRSPCQDFPDADGIVVSLKTRAAKAYAKIPPHFLTHLQCLADTLVFSDMVSFSPQSSDSVAAGIARV
jgi:hypothetical protein